MKKLLYRSQLLLCLLLAAVLLLTGCTGSKEQQQGEAKPQKVVITDLAGRQVEVQVPVKRVVAVGPGALRLVCYVNGAEKVVGIENLEKQQPKGRPYILAYPRLKELSVIGQGGPNSTPDAEKIASVKPDVIFIASLVDKAGADQLQAKTGVPVVFISYGKTGSFDEDLYRSLEIIGKIIGEEERAKEVVAFIKNCQKDLNSRTQGIAAGEKPKVYVGALGMRGTHGIESTQAKYFPLAAINARNVADETGQKGSIMIEKEKLLAWNPDIIFIDEGGLPLVLDDYKKNPSFYRSLQAVQKGEVYGQLPFNHYWTNIDTALADAYWAGKVVFPDRFKDIDPAQKADEIYRFFLGQPLYRQMAADFGGFKKINLAGQ